MDREFLDTLIGLKNQVAEVKTKAKGFVPLLVPQGKFLPDIIRSNTVILTHKNGVITFAESSEE